MGGLGGVCVAMVVRCVWVVVGVDVHSPDGLVWVDGLVISLIFPEIREFEGESAVALAKGDDSSKKGLPLPGLGLGVGPR